MTNQADGTDYGQEDFVTIFDMAIELLQDIMVRYTEADETWKNIIGTDGSSNRFAKEQLSDKVKTDIGNSSNSIAESVKQKTTLSRGSLYRARYGRY